MPLPDHDPTAPADSRPGATPSRSAAEQPAADREVCREDDASDKRAGIQFSAALAVAVAVIATAIFFSLPANLLWSPQHPGPVTKFIATQMPEKWAFFTKKPQSSQYGAYAISPSGTAASLLQTPQTLPRNAFGLSRTQRAQGAEVAILDHAASFHDCDDYLDSCVEDAMTQPLDSIVNPTKTQTICGNVVLTEQKLIPWSYRNQSRTDQPWILRLAKVHVQC